jgi:lysophospholipase L1-like esterase
VSAVAAPWKIACIGDSITEGAGLSNPATEGYPAKLGRLLGTKYWKETSFVSSHDWQPDLVIIQLGTNDSKPQNWRYSTNFVADYEELVASYAGLTNHPRVIVCTPCVVYGNGAFGINPGIIATNIAPGLRDLASRLELDLIDLHLKLAGHPEWFPDTVHPNSKGTTAMAAVMFTGLAGTPTADPPESVAIHRPVRNRAVLSWAAVSRGLVPQFAAALRGTNTAWSVSEQPIYLEGDIVRQTNSISGPARFYRLWQP